MFIKKNFSFRNVMHFSGHHIVWIVAWVSSVAALYHYVGLEMLTIPWLPLSIIGTAVAFYVGFKNNSAYNRMWEARMIWGAIVNSSRSWGASLNGFITNQFTDENVSEEELLSVKKGLIYRHIAWLYTLRSQLLAAQPWEHVSQKGLVGKAAVRYRKLYGIGTLGDTDLDVDLKAWLDAEELADLSNAKNKATQLINKQAEALSELRKRGLIEDFRHMELQNILNDFYTHQGKCERIKKFPLPRQYGSMSTFFVGIFIFLLPFGLVSEFSKIGTWGIALSIPFTSLVAWVFLVMELVGDYTENPFQGLGNDIPMMSLCRTIEIDLRQMLGEEDLPQAIEPSNGILM